MVFVIRYQVRVEREDGMIREAQIVRSIEAEDEDAALESYRATVDSEDVSATAQWVGDWG